MRRPARAASYAQPLTHARAHTRNASEPHAREQNPSRTPTHPPHPRRFKSDNFTKAISAIKAKVRSGGEKDGFGEKGGRGGKGRGIGAGGKGGGRGGKGGGKGGGEASDCFKLVQLIVGKGCDPVIVFAFGKTKCEKLAKEMEGLSLNTQARAPVCLSTPFDALRRPSTRPLTPTHTPPLPTPKSARLLPRTRARTAWPMMTSSMQVL